jgi:hypothetical protein
LVPRRALENLGPEFTQWTDGGESNLKEKSTLQVAHGELLGLAVRIFREGTLGRVEERQNEELDKAWSRVLAILFRTDTQAFSSSPVRSKSKSDHNADRTILKK